MKLDKWCQALKENYWPVRGTANNAIYCDHGIQMSLKCCGLGVFPSPRLPNDLRTHRGPQTLSGSLWSLYSWCTGWATGSTAHGVQKMLESRCRDRVESLEKGEIPPCLDRHVAWSRQRCQRRVGVGKTRGLPELCFFLLLLQRVSICFLFFLNLTLSLKDRQDECYDAYCKILDLKV